LIFIYLDVTEPNLPTSVYIMFIEL